MNQELSVKSSLIDRQPRLRERFEVLSILGEGAAGTVYKVRDRVRGGDIVALKILQNTDAFDENTKRRFKNEISVACSFDHPNFIRAYELIEGDHSLAYTMEFVEGADLGRIFDKGEMTSERIDSIFIQLLDCLSALHSRGYLHRDIKLENIMVRPDGVVKLSDLGLMKDLNNTKITRTGVLLGTAQYMPPEYIRKCIYDVRGDIYSVGVLLYEILTRKRRLVEYPGMRAIEHLIQTKFELPKLPLQGAPKKYVRIAAKAAALKPADRYQSAAEMMAEFKNLEALHDDDQAYRSTTQVNVKTKAGGEALGGGRTIRPAVLVLTAVFSCIAALASGLMMRGTGPRLQPVEAVRTPKLYPRFFESMPIDYNGQIKMSGPNQSAYRAAAERDGSALKIKTLNPGCAEALMDISLGTGACSPSGWPVEISKIAENITADVIIEGQKSGVIVLDVGKATLDPKSGGEGLPSKAIRRR